VAGLVAVSRGHLSALSAHRSLSQKRCFAGLLWIEQNGRIARSIVRQRSKLAHAPGGQSSLLLAFGRLIHYNL
jgi:hypothetical protein